MTKELLRVPAPPAFRFLVELGGDKVGAFTECTLPVIEVDIEEVKEGGLNSYTHQLPGQRRGARVTLKNGIGHRKLVEWYFAALSEQFRDGKTPLRQPVTISLFDSRHTQLMEWHIDGAFPIRWMGPQLRTDDTTVAIQTLELACGPITVSYRGKD
jgi:phage tail-like protein